MLTLHRCCATAEASAVEDPLDDAPRPAGESAGSRRRGARPTRAGSPRAARPRPARAPRWAGCPAGRPRQSTTALRTREASVQAAASDARRRRRRPGRRRRPRRSAAEGAGVRSAGTSCACRSCSSCTVHSTSERPPRPSLRCRCGSAPRGSRSASTRALIRRISRTSASVEPAAGQRSGSTRARNRSPELGVARHGHGPQQRLRLPRQRPARVVLRVRGERCAPAGRCGPRGAGRRRRRAAGRAPGDAEQPAQLAGHRERRLLRGALVGARAAGRARTARRRRCRSRARAPPSRPIATTSIRVGSGPPRRRSTARVAARSPPSSAAAATSVSAGPDRPSVEQPEHVGDGDPDQLAAADARERARPRPPGRRVPRQRRAALGAQRRLARRAAAARRRRRAARTASGARSSRSAA